MSEEKKDLPAKDPVERYAVFYLRTHVEPIPQAVGLGIHGYTINTSPNKRGYGLKRVIPTPKGYEDESSFPLPVIENLIDLRVGYLGPHNEVGCIADGVKRILELVLSEETVHTQTVGEEEIRLREVHVLLPMTSHVRMLAQIGKLREKGWKDRNGEPIPFHETLEAVEKLIDMVRERAIEVNFGAAPSEGGIGNEHSSYNAKDAASLAIKNRPCEACDFVSPLGYWNYDHGRSPWFNKSRLLTLTHHEPEGERFYHLMDHESNKDDKESCIGLYLPMISLSVVRAVDVDPVLNQIMHEQNLHTPVGEKRAVLLMLDNIYRPNSHRALSNNGVPYLRSSSVTVDLTDSRDVTMTQELYPPRQAFRLIEEASRNEELLKEAIDAVKNGLAEFTAKFYGKVVVSDVSAKFFTETTNEKGKVTYGITKEVEVPNTSVQVTALTEHGEKVITLSIGMDTPKRNALAAMAGEGIKAYLLTNAETETTVAYRLLIVKGEEAGIWVTPYANRLFIKTS